MARRWRPIWPRMADPEHVRGVIAEGVTPVGLGPPNQTGCP